MGEPEQVIAEPDEVEDVDASIDGLHPPTLEQHHPWLISYSINSALSWLAFNGWYTLGFLLLCYILWRRIEPKCQQWLRKREEFKEAAKYHKDPDKVLARERALDEARLRMQEQYNKDAQKQAEKRKEQEEKRRLERIEDWERHKRGDGYRSKTRTGASGSSEVESNNANKPSRKPKLRPEYNPLTGDTGGGTCGWRPSQRGASGGG